MDENDCNHRKRIVENAAWLTGREVRLITLIGLKDSGRKYNHYVAAFVIPKSYNPHIPGLDFDKQVLFSSEYVCPPHTKLQHNMVEIVVKRLRQDIERIMGHVIHRGFEGHTVERGEMKASWVFVPPDKDTRPGEYPRYRNLEVEAVQEKGISKVRGRRGTFKELPPQKRQKIGGEGGEGGHDEEEVIKETPPPPPNDKPVTPRPLFLFRKHVPDKPIYESDYGTTPTGGPISHVNHPLKAPGSRKTPDTKAYIPEKGKEKRSELEVVEPDHPYATPDPEIYGLETDEAKKKRLTASLAYLTELLEAESKKDATGI